MKEAALALVDKICSCFHMYYLKVIIAFWLTSVSHYIVFVKIIPECFIQFHPFWVHNLSLHKIRINQPTLILYHLLLSKCGWFSMNFCS